MKILKANAGALTNFEVLDFLGSRGAAKDPTWIIVSMAPSEFKSIAFNQSRGSITEFVGKCNKYKLAKAEILNIINIGSSSVVEIDPIIPECEARLGESVEEMVELVAEVLRSPQTQMESDETAAGEDKGDIPDGEPHCSIEL
ncbi:hypothetical protein U1Q18_031320 [Sarracenia purpurea var. burkii]